MTVLQGLLFHLESVEYKRRSVVGWIRKVPCVGAIVVAISVMWSSSSWMSVVGVAVLDVPLLSSLLLSSSLSCIAVSSNICRFASAMGESAVLVASELAEDKGCLVAISVVGRGRVWLEAFDWGWSFGSDSWIPGVLG